MLSHHRLDRCSAKLEVSQLKQETLLQIASTNTDGVEALYETECLVNLGTGVVSHGADFVD